jgi:hypothetical protein
MVGQLGSDEIEAADDERLEPGGARAALSSLTSPVLPIPASPATRIADPASRLGPPQGVLQALELVGAPDQRPAARRWRIAIGVGEG